jgi:prevent-host-death family protein
LSLVEASVTDLRTDFKTWLDRVRSGQTVTITERGVPIARISPVGVDEKLRALVDAGVLTSMERPKRKAPARGVKLKGKGSILEYLER